MPTSLGVSPPTVHGLLQMLAFAPEPVVVGLLAAVGERQLRWVGR